MDTTSNIFESEIVDAVHSVISKRVKEECRKAIDEAHVRIEEKLSEIVASISLNIMKQVSFEHLRNELIVHVKIQPANHSSTERTEP